MFRPHQKVRVFRELLKDTVSMVVLEVTVKSIPKENRVPLAGGGRKGGKVIKGMRMGGRMGSDRITVKNLKVIGIDKENNEMMISGAVPGRRGTLIEIRSTK